MLFASKVHCKVRELIKELENNILLVINKFSEILNKLSTSPRWTKRSGNLLKLLNRVESFFRILVSEIIEKSRCLVFLFHSSIFRELIMKDR